MPYNRSLRLFITIAILVLMPLSIWPLLRSDRPAPAAQTVAETGLKEARLTLPMSFEANRGQSAAEVRFLARGQGYTLFLTDREAVLALQLAPAEARALLKMRLANAQARGDIAGVELLPGKSNYFIGNDPAQWRTDVPHFAKVRYPQVYPGIDLVYYGNQRQLEYDFIVSPGADPDAIKINFDGVKDLALNSAGELVMSLDAGEVVQRRPVAYQEIEGERELIASNYVIRDDGAIGFELGDYDKSRPLVIDPILVYSTFLGGTGNDQGDDITIDAAGNAYFTGLTTSVNFPTSNPLQPANAGGQDVFVTKINAAGTALVYSTYLGGASNEQARGIFVDSAGSAYVSGFTVSTNFPLAGTPFQSANAGSNDLFVTKLNAAGNALVYSTYLGGSGSDVGGVGNIEVDSGGNAYVTGTTTSANFPVTPAAFQTTFGGGADSFVTKLNATGSALVYSTYLGGSGSEDGANINVDSQGNAYLTGETTSVNFPTLGAFQPTFGGVRDAFVTKVNSTGSALVFSSFLGGSQDERGNGLDIDSAGNVYVNGRTASTNFPVTAQAFQTVYKGGPFDTFVAKINAAGSALVYATYLGGSGDERCRGISVDAQGRAYVVGVTSSIDFPLAGSPVQATFGGGAFDLFVSRLDAQGSVLLTSTYLGGSQQDQSGFGIAIDAAGNAFVTGFSNSANFPTAGALQPVNGGLNDAIVARLMNTPGTLQLNTGTALVSETTGQISFTVTRAGGSDGLVTVDFATSDGTAKAGADYTAASGTLTFAPGVTSQSFTVKVNEDLLNEANETFSVTLSNATDGAIIGAPGSATVTITDNDAIPSLLINDTMVTEGNDGKTMAIFTVTLTAASGQNVTVDFSTADGSATAGSDYSAATGKLTFSAGTTSQTVTVLVNGDTLNEGDETFTVRLANAANANIFDGLGIATIANDDALPVVQFGAGSFTVTEGGTATISIMRTSNSTGEVTVSFVTNNGTASAGSDFNDLSTTLVFASGETSKTISLTTIDDRDVEGAETVSLVLANPTGSTLGLATATLTINDNDVAQPGQLQFRATAFAASEDAGTVLVAVTRAGGSNVPVTVNFQATDGSATAGLDYGETAGTLTFAAGVTSQTFALRVFDDNVLEGDETINLSLSGPGGGATLGSIARAVVTITDNDVAQPGQLQFSTAAFTVSERAGSVEITVSRAGGSNVPVAVSYTAANGTASAGSDFQTNAGTLSFGVGVTSQSFTIFVNDDDQVEGDETVNLQLSGATNGAGIALSSAQLVIVDDDLQSNTPVLQVDQRVIDFGEQLIGTSATRTVTVRNGGRATLNFSTPQIGGFNNFGFSIVGLPATTTLAPGASTTFVVGFRPTLPLLATLTANIMISSNGGTANLLIRGRGFDDVAPTVALAAPAGGEVVTAGQPFTIRFSGSDNDQVGGFIISVSDDGGATFRTEIARIGSSFNQVIWNVPERLETANARIRVIARDRAGNTSVALSNSFTVQRPAVMNPGAMVQVDITFDPPPAGQVAPPQNVKVNAAEMKSGTGVIRTAAEDDELMPELIGYNVYRVPAPREGEPLPTADEIVSNPANLVGSVGAASTSFTDMVSTANGQNFVYSITSFFGGGQMSGGSMPTSTDLPVIKNPRFQKGTIMLEAAGSLIKPGAVLIVDDNDSYALQFDDSGALLMVPNKLKGSGGRTIKKVIKKGANVRLTVRNPDGKVSVGVMFMRN